jgi:hypothetical protein
MRAMFAAMSDHDDVALGGLVALACAAEQARHDDSQ